MSLTDKAIQALKPKDKLYRVTDSDNLMIEVCISGSKLWRYRYQFNGKAKMLSLGKYPTITLSQARQNRNDAKNILLSGIDPNALKQESKAAAKEQSVIVEEKKEAEELTFNKLFLQWYDTRTHEWTPSHADKVFQRVNNHLIPYIGNAPIKDITPLMIIDALKRLDDSGKTHMRMKVKGIAAMVFKYGIEYGLTTNDPTASLPDSIFKAHVTQHYATVTDPKDVKKLLAILRTCEDFGGVCGALRLAPLVFLRPSELAGLRWDEVDFDAKLIRLSGNDKTTGRRMKNELDHLIPLSRQALAILDDRLAHKVCDHVFYNLSTYEAINAESIRQRIRRLGISKETFTPHGFRHTASTNLNELGFNSDVIEKQLAHKETNSVRRAYNHAQYLPERTRMMQVWADWLDELTTKTENPY
jgi:integrase